MFTSILLSQGICHHHPVSEMNRLPSSMLTISNYTRSPHMLMSSLQSSSTADWTDQYNQFIYEMEQSVLSQTSGTTTTTTTRQQQQQTRKRHYCPPRNCCRCARVDQIPAATGQTGPALPLLTSRDKQTLISLLEPRWPGHLGNGKADAIFIPGTEIFTV